MNDLQNYTRKRYLRSCIKGTCRHEFCPNRNLEIKNIQPTQAERLAYSEHYKLIIEKNQMSKKSMRTASKNWKIKNPEKHAAIQKQWADNNRDKIKEINRKHREKMKNKELK